MTEFSLILPEFSQFLKILGGVTPHTPPHPPVATPLVSSSMMSSVGIGGSSVDRLMAVWQCSLVTDGAMYKIKCADCPATYIGETGRNLKIRLTEHKPATKNGHKTNHIAGHHRQTKHNIDWDSAECLTYNTNYRQRITIESWYTNLEKEPLNRSQQLPPPYKRLIHNSTKQ